jgi:hypothetical protein
MKRFVDIREAETGWNFAWWDTIEDKFETHGGSMAWTDWKDFEQMYEGDIIQRYKALVPEWVFE